MKEFILSHHCLPLKCICECGLYVCAHMWKEVRGKGGCMQHNLIDWLSAALEMAV